MPFSRHRYPKQLSVMPADIFRMGGIEPTALGIARATLHGLKAFYCGPKVKWGVEGTGNMTLCSHMNEGTHIRPCLCQA